MYKKDQHALVIDKYKFSLCMHFHFA